MQDWPHQIQGVQDTLAAIARGERRVCLTTPTGGGKTRQMIRLLEHYAGRKCVVYSNRKMLLDQLSSVLEGAGLEHGRRQAGKEQDEGYYLQLSSMQTEHARVHKSKKWEMHHADLVIVDECHLHTGPTATSICDSHIADGAVVVGFTATPLGLGAMYETLIVAGRMSELRRCGACVPCIHYAPDEPLLKVSKQNPLGEELTEKQKVAAMNRPGLFGRVWDNWKRINTDGLATILFAPDVAGSLWFAEQFRSKGIKAAHIDGDSIWLDGRLHENNSNLRTEILEESRNGRIRVISNRYVLREGIDAPWLRHCVLATVYGSLQSYLQSGGRLLRAYPGVEAKTLQDHGGNWWRHGSLNADREWNLAYDGRIASGLRAERIRSKTCCKCKARLGDGPWCPECEAWNEKEAAVCPQCGRVRFGSKCPCGHVATSEKKSRPVVTEAGDLKEQSGDIFRPHRVTKSPTGLKIWEGLFWGARKSPKWNPTFRQLQAYFLQKTKDFGWPDRSWPFMPKNDVDLFRLVKDVPMENLIQKPLSEGGAN